MQRADLDFSSHGTRCAAWLYRADSDGPAPCVILAHGFAGTRDARLDAYAERFVKAGVSALVFDYRHFGDSDGEPRQLLDIGLQLEDWRAALAFARSLEGIDPARVALWGTSFSGGHVIQIGSDDPGVAAVIAQCPFVDGVAALRAGGVASALRLTGAGLRDEFHRLTRRPPHMCAVVGAPGTVAAMTSPDAEPGYRAIVASGGTWRNEVCGRVALRIATYRPGRRVGALRSPLMVCVCDADVVTPAEPVLRAVRSHPNTQVRHYPGGHFDIYVGDTFELAVADQVEFLTYVLAPPGVPA